MRNAGITQMDAAAEIVIARSRADIATLMFDPRNDPLWASRVVECRPLSSGPMRPGMRIEQTSRMFGTTGKITYEVVSIDPERFMELRVDDPFEMWVLQELEDTPGGTRVRVRTKIVGGEPGFFRLFGPLLGYLTRRNIRRDLNRLKRLMEAEPA